MLYMPASESVPQSIILNVSTLQENVHHEDVHQDVPQQNQVQQQGLLLQPNPLQQGALLQPSELEVLQQSLNQVQQMQQQFQLQQQLQPLQIPKPLAASSPGIDTQNEKVVCCFQYVISLNLYLDSEVC